MSDDPSVRLDLDPKKVIDGLAQLKAEFQNLSNSINNSLGKDAPKSIQTLEESAERGTGRISEQFRNLSQRVREDLRTAFDASGVLAGAKFAKDIGEGVAQVFELERAFDRLNNRLKLSNREMTDFKTNLGRKVASTGQRLEDVLPGVETASAKGGVTDAGQLANIGEALGKVRAATGEDADQLSDTVVQILKDQGRQVTAESYRATLDALQGTRVSGNFHSANEAGLAVQSLTHGLSPEQQKRLGLDTRSTGGLAAAASTAGAGGIEALQNILKTASQAGGTDKLNAIFGTQLFKGGKLDAAAFGDIDKNRFGQYSEQTLASATGMDQAELSRFIDAMKGGMAQFNGVVTGSNETASQFEVASDNLASGADRFKERVKQAGREIGEQLSQTASELLKGNFGSAWDKAKGAVGAADENKGTLLAAGALTAGVGILAGGGISRLLGRVGGADTAMNFAKGQAYKQAGVEPVFVVNAKEIGDSASSGLGGKFDPTKSFGGYAGQIGKTVLGATAKGVVGGFAAFEVGQAIGEALLQVPGIQRAMNSAGDYTYDKLNGSDAQSLAAAESAQNAKLAASFNERNGTQLTAAEYAKAVEDGTLRAHSRANTKATYTNPSSVTGRGG